MITAAHIPEQNSPAWGVGDLVLDTYRVERISTGADRHYAEGGMGRVYRLFHTGWGVDLAAKVPLLEQASGSVGRQAFIDECQTWVNLAPHPHVVPCHYVRMVGQLPVVFAEFVEGGSLAQWINNGTVYEDGHRNALLRILDIAIQTAWGLHHSHQQQLVHQDMKPANVMMTPDGTAMITDFGLARARVAGGIGGLLGGPGHSVMVPGSGFMTVEYASPEQIGGRPLTRRSDMWSWAVSVLEMFVGELTWKTGLVAPEVLQRCRTNGAERPEVPPLPDPVGDLLARCLRHDPDERFTDMAVIAATLRDMFPRVAGQEHQRPVPKLVEMRAGTLNNKALSLLDLGDEQTARRLLCQAIRANPMHAEATYNLGVLDWRGGSTTDVALLTELQSIQSTGPNIRCPRFLSCLVHLERGDRESALEILSDSRGQGPSDHELQNAIGRAESLPPDTGCCIRVLDGHEGPLTGLAADTDGRMLLSSAWDRTVRIWSIPAGRCDRVLAGHRAPVVGVVLSHDGCLAVSASRDGEIRLWNTASGNCERTIETQHKEVWSVAADPACASVCLATGDHRVWHHDLRTGRCLGSFSGHTGVIWAMLVSPDGTSLLTVSWDGTLVMWDLATHEPRKLTDLYAGQLRAIAVMPDSLTVMVGSEQMRFMHVDPLSGVTLRNFTGHGGSVNALAVSADGRFVASTSADKTVRMWDVASGRCLRTYEGYEISAGSVAFSPDGRMILSGGSDGRIHLWNVPIIKPSHFALSRPQTVGAQAASGQEHKAKLIQARRAMELGEIDRALRLVAEARAVPEFALSRKALDLLAAAGQFGRRTRLDLALPSEMQSATALRVNCLAIEPNDRHAARLCQHGIRSGGETWSLLDFQVETRLAIAGFKSGDVYLLNLANWQRSFAIENQQAPVWSVEFLPGGCRSRVHPSVKRARTYEVPSGRRVPDDDSPSSCQGDLEYGLGSAKRRSATVGSGSQSWDGCWQLSIDERSLLVFTRPPNHEKLHLLTEDDDPLTSCVTIAPDGRYGFSGGLDGLVRVWDLAEHRCTHRLEGHRSSVTCIACSVDARWVLAGAEDGAVRLWELVWEYEFPGWAGWPAAAQPQAEAFLTRAGITRLSELTDEIQCHWLLDLQALGYGWVRPEESLAALRRVLE